MESLGNSSKNPNLDEIINQITSNGEFKDMMTQLSDELATNKNNNQDDKESTPEVDSDFSSENVEKLNNYDLLTTFFSDQNGNNICEILNEINNNLAKLVEKLPDKVN